MVHLCVVLTFGLLITAINAETTHVDQIKQLVAQWAPLIWLSPEEKHFPSSVNRFFANVHLADQNGKSIKNSTLNERNFPQSDTSNLYLVTKRSLESQSEEKSSFLNGFNPKHYEIPIYALVTSCTPHISFYSTDFRSISDDINVLYGKMEPKLYFHVTYWAFYPFNKGKNICFLAGKVPSIRIFGRCLGSYKTMGSHVGDWERMSLSFQGKQFPTEMFLSIHDSGGFYRYDPLQGNFKHDPQRASKQIRIVQKPKLPPRVRLQNGHPVLFAAEGSHGFWPSPGDHEYVKIPKLTDRCGYGIPWKTWRTLEITVFGVDRVPEWMYYKGRWGNPSSNCLISSQLGLCEYSAGPTGILRKKQDFYC